MLKCNSKNPKFKNLTIGKDYEGVIEGDFAEVLNDTGVKVRYNKKYFSDIAITPPAPRRPVVANLSLDDIINDIDIDYDGGDIITIETSYLSEYSVNVFQANNSCGVLQFDGMNVVADFVRSILNYISNNNNMTTTVSDAQLFEALMRSILNVISDEFNRPFIMLTTNEPHRSMFELFNNRFNIGESLSVKTEIRNNPGGSSEIAVWVVDLEDYLA